MVRFPRLPAGLWLVIGVFGVAVAAVGARVYAAAVDGYIAANPWFYRDFYNVPAPSDAESRLAYAGAALLVIGLAVAVVSSLVRLRTTKRRWVLLRGVAAGATGLVLVDIGLKGWFQLYVNTLCGDCTPSPPDQPWPAFSAGAAVLLWAMLLGLLLACFLVVWAVLQRKASPPTPQVGL